MVYNPSNIDTKRFKKLDPKGYQHWKLIQQITYSNKKINKKTLKKAWPHIKDQLYIDTKKALEYFLWGRKWQKEPGLRLDRSNYWKWYHNKMLSKKTNSISLAALRLQLSTITTESPTI